MTRATSSIPHRYTAPPIDVHIAREWGLIADDRLTEQLVQSINRALQSMPNPRHAYIWARFHGVNDDGTLGEPWSCAQIGRSLGGKTKEYVGHCYYRASSHVWRNVALDLYQTISTTR